MPKNIFFLTACLLAAGIFNLPYGYYMFLRIAVSLFCAVLCASDFFRGRAGWSVIWLTMLILFNPVFPIHFDKEIWSVIDGAAALLVAAYALMPSSQTRSGAAGSFCVTKPFNAVMEGLIGPESAKTPSWWNADRERKRFLDLIHQELTVRKPILGNSFFRISHTVRCAIKNAAAALEEKGFSLEDSAVLIAVHMVNYSRISGVESLLEE